MVCKGGHVINDKRKRGLMCMYEGKPIFHRGEIYFADLDPIKGSEQGGVRPVLILQNDTGNRFAPTLIVAPLTSREKKKILQPTHVLLKGIPGLTMASVVVLEQIKTLDKKRILHYVGHVSKGQMQEVEVALKKSLDLR